MTLRELPFGYTAEAQLLCPLSQETLHRIIEEAKAYVLERVSGSDAELDGHLQMCAADRLRHHPRLFRGRERAAVAAAAIRQMVLAGTRTWLEAPNETEGEGGFRGGLFMTDSSEGVGAALSLLRRVCSEDATK